MPRPPGNKGFTLIEVLVSLAVLAILFVGVYQLVILSLGLTNDSKLYVEATEIANQKMERIMNMPYDLVGVVGGIPNGPIPQTETVTRSGTFTIDTYIRYHDDPFDGTMGSTTKPDTIGVDYKIVTIKTSWYGRTGERSFQLFTKLIPRTMETLHGYGLLEILVNDADGQPIPGANVHVYNPVATATVIDVTYPTDANGYLYLPAWASSQSYEITASLPGYSFEKTYATSTALPNPIRKNLSVIEGQKTSNSFTIDTLARLNIRTLTQSVPEPWQASPAMSGQNAIAADLAPGEDGYFYYAWQAWNATSSFVMAGKFDTDGNASWASPLTVAGSDRAFGPRIMGEPGGGAILVWHDDRNGDNDIQAMRVNSAGATLWGPTTMNETATATDQSQPALARRLAPDATSTVAWRDMRNGNYDIYLMAFDTAGNRLWGADVQVTSGTFDDISPAAAINGLDRIYVAWVEDRGSDEDILAMAYDLTGTPLWGAPASIAATADKEYGISLAADTAGDLYAAWVSDNGTVRSVHTAKIMSDGSVSWQIEPNVHSGIADRYDPTIGTYGSAYAYVAWTDARNGDDNIYAQKIDPAGTKVWASDMRLNIEVDIRPQDTPAISIDPADRRLAVWQDEAPDNEYDLWSVKFSEPGAIVDLPGQPLNIRGSKLIGTGPDILKFDIATTTGATGRLSLVLEYDSAYTVDLIAASTTYTLADSDPSQPLSLMPGATVDLILNLE